MGLLTIFAARTFGVWEWLSPHDPNFLDIPKTIERTKKKNNEKVNGMRMNALKVS